MAIHHGTGTFVEVNGDVLMIETSQIEDRCAIRFSLPYSEDTNHRTFASIIECLLNLCLQEGIHPAKFIEELLRKEHTLSVDGLTAKKIAEAIREHLLPGCPFCDSKDVTYPGNTIRCNACHRFALSVRR